MGISGSPPSVTVRGLILMLQNEFNLNLCCLCEQVMNSPGLPQVTPERLAAWTERLHGNNAAEVNAAAMVLSIKRMLLIDLLFVRQQRNIPVSDV